VSERAAGEPNGLASMLEALLRANLDREPARRRLLGRGVVELVARDADVSAVVDLSPNAPLVSAGPALEADVRIAASSDDLLALAAAPLRFGCPDPLRPEGRAVLGAIVRGRVRIVGLLAHPLLVARLARLLSVA
jgi:hypothetical protein